MPDIGGNRTAQWSVCVVLYMATLPMGAIGQEATVQVLFSEGFEDDKLESRGWYDLTHCRIVRKGVAGNCIEFEWLAGDSQTRGSSGMRRLFEASEEVYLRYYLKLSKSWQWTGRNYHPHLTHFLTTENPTFAAPATTHLTLYVEPVGGKLRLAASDMQNKDEPHGVTQGPLRGGFNGMLYDSQEVLFTDDKWHCVEAHFKLNSLDLAQDRPNGDGMVRAWFDGRLVVEHRDVILRSTDFPSMRFNQFLLMPYFGSGLLPQAQKLWIDELVVSQERIGPLTDTSR